MRSLLLAVPFLVVGGSALALNPVLTPQKGGKSLQKEARTVGAFDRIVASGALTVDIKQGKPSLTLEAEKAVLPHLKTYVKDSTLFIETVGRFNSDAPMKAHVTVPELRGLVLSGATTATSRVAWKAKQFEITESGASQAELTVETDRLSVVGMGASQAELSGSADQLTLNLSGASKYAGGRYALNGADVVLSGASEATLSAKTSISGAIAGASKLRYRGTPKVSVKSSGVSELKRL